MAEFVGKRLKLMRLANLLYVLVVVTHVVIQTSALTFICVINSLSKVCFTEHGNGARCNLKRDLRGTAILTAGGSLQERMPVSEIVLLKEDDSNASGCPVAGTLRQTKIPTAGVTCGIDHGLTPRDEDEGDFSTFSFGDRLFNLC
eukprot:TRINITY_DN63245_c0_g1_i1.p1 TRINITY_DN63245_c0_g1~~TRINITY_DN63245_c0_g1_i1.p1  ORF type:complete len:145 (+),score=15.79 TRINITY_DN63245_c0_g1_i1:22-456(+)